MDAPARDGDGRSDDRRRWRLGRLGRNVWMIGLVSLLNDTASEMVTPLLPLFLTQTLGAGALAVGWIEGAADAASSILKLLAGRVSDRLGRHKPFLLAGYSLACSVRPLYAFTQQAWQVLAIRVGDRIGKGVRTSPRDALLARSVPPRHRGAAFGVHRGMDHAGAVLGPLVAAAFLTWHSADLRRLFLWTAVPGALVLLVLLFGVTEPPRRADAPRDGGGERTRPSPAVAAAGSEGAALLRFLLPLGLFTLGNASDAFLLLLAAGRGASFVQVALMWSALHVVRALTTVPGGLLADRFGARRVIAVGWLVYALVYVGFAFAPDRGTVVALFLAYGLYTGLTDAPERAFVSRLTSRARQGTAFGWFHLTLGLLTLAASVLFGALWQAFGPRTAFLASAGLALAAAALLLRERAEDHQLTDGTAG